MAQSEKTTVANSSKTTPFRVAYLAMLQKHLLACEPIRRVYYPMVACYHPGIGRHNCSLGAYLDDQL